ncbi:MAG: carboxypeptidase-like regulatory domain-containing protein, partial [Ferruginibacter sp.]
MRRKLNLLTAIFILLSFLGEAQETTSEIQGTVSDNTAVPLAGATITALHQPTGTKYVTTSRKDGRFNLANLRIGGPYEVKVSYVGFNEGKQENINLLLGQE